MIKTIRYFIVLSPILLTSFECSDSITNPPNYPPGYQFDIPWPSLADSPWPIYRGNPQATGRSKENLNLQGVVEWTSNHLNGILNTSLVIDKDSNIYASTYFGTSSMSIVRRDGSILQSIGNGNSYTPPILLSDGATYHFEQNRVIRYNSDKTIKWIYGIQIGEDPETKINIGIDGTLYVVGSGKIIYAINPDGNLKWSYNVQQFISGLTLSPDGRTLYFSSDSIALTAFDINSQSSKWQVGKGKSKWTMVDYYGNIYCSAKVDTINSGKGGLFCINPSGKIRWYKEHAMWVQNVSYLPAPTIDNEGNIYFVSDSIYSFDYAGNKRWSKYPENDFFVVTPLVCDKNGNIYILYQVTLYNFYLFALTNRGDVLFKTFFPGVDSDESPSIANRRLYIPTNKNSFFYSVK